jgi:hypothetical protein
MSMICKRTWTKTPIGSPLSVSWNTDDLRGKLTSITIVPTSSDTTYDFVMTDDQSLDVYRRNQVLGTFRDDSSKGFYGIYTFKIDNASVSEPITIQLVYEEIPS